ncbi:MAG: hypothetical protein GF331_01435 [Chitinivibrionales bacterium]|nr:hypothetical protein [Chitinivibrionales bacterium]
MAGDDHKREKLIGLLDQKVFDPILSTSLKDYVTEERRTLFQDFRRSMENEKRRYHEHYHSAAEVKDGYLTDLRSVDTEQQNTEAEDLELPKLSDVQNEFMRLCEELHV